MKAYVAAMIVGTAAVAVAVLVLRQEQAAVPAADVPSIDSATAKRRSGSAVEPAQQSSPVRDPSVRARDPDQVAALPAVSNTAEPDPEDWDTPCACAGAWHARKEERERAAREAEPKDINWAYEMEQLLEQFIAAHPQARTIQISGIECRTSFCEIKAIAHPGSWDAFEAVVEQALNEPWSTLSGNRSLRSNSRDDGQQGFHAIIERTSIAATTSAADHLLSSVPGGDEEECECATSEWQMRKAEHEAAARAAEPKDVYWAYATEQQLQQFIAAHPQAITFQVSSIDCRTTFCEIKAIGLTDQSAEIFGDIIREGVAQERSGLDQGVASGSSRSDGRIEMDARVTRRR